ncbi:MAG: VPS10 domain-containing protein [Dehalococcoidia bacterium]
MPIAVDQLQTMQWRNIGPHRGGRVVAVAGDPANPMIFYFGACAGGVWKTTDGGTYWQNVSDGFFDTAAVGAIAVADSDPNVVYAGMGECCIRGDVSHGDGVYRSTDAGRTWQHLGLEATRSIARVRVHPKDPDIVYVAALGDIFGPSQERGVYRSKNGGKTWEKVLFRDENTGAIDLSLDPSNPRILYAALWQVRRTPWSLTSGGPGSGLYKSTDGGDTWTEISDNRGLPKGLKGRIGVAVSPARPGRVFALMEAEKDGSGLYRSEDGGASWQRISEDREIQGRRWYYMHVFPDPQDADTVWVLSGRCFKSIDGGVSWQEMPTPHGDNHDLWIDPRNPSRMIEGNDGGACVSFNGGLTWSTIYNQPTAQFYHVAVDTRFPYHVYGTQQDNTAIAVPSRTNKGGIPINECYTVGHSESGHIQVRPDNPDVVYSGAIGSSPGGGGALLRYDNTTGQIRIITAWPEFYGGWGAKDLKYRFQWTYPIVISPHDPTTLYVTGNRVFRTRDEGTSWEVISPDLTRDDKTKQEPSGGPITKDTTGAEHYCTIVAFAESPHQQGVLWAGSDDGLIHLSRDAGQSWQNVTPPDLPEWSTVCAIEVSPHDPATAYVAATRYKLDDFAPSLHKTSDYGQTWQRITTGIPADDFTRVIRADPVRRGLLYAGTETGLYVSFDDGAHWQRFQNNLPVVPVYDLTVKDSDLVAATHGRSFWVLDDLTPLRQHTDEIADRAAHLFPPRPTIRFRAAGGAGKALPGVNYSGGIGGVSYVEKKKPDGEIERTLLDAGTNPPDGVIVHYHLKERPAGDLTLEFLDADGRVIRAFSSRPEENPEPPAEEPPGTEEENVEEPDLPLRQEDRRAPKEAGLNRFVWNMREPDATKLPGDIPTERNLAGPLIPPGAYQVRLTLNGESQSAPFEVRKDPRVAATREDLDAQYELLIQLRAKLSETHDAVLRLRGIRSQIEGWESRTKDSRDHRAIAGAAKVLKGRLIAIEEELVQTKARGESDRLNHPGRLNAKLVHLTAVVASADWVPPRQTYEVFEHLVSRIDGHLSELSRVIETDVPAFSALIREADLPAVGVVEAAPVGD